VDYGDAGRQHGGVGRSSQNKKVKYPYYIIHCLSH